MFLTANMQGPSPGLSSLGPWARPAPGLQRFGPSRGNSTLQRNNGDMDATWFSWCKNSWDVDEHPWKLIWRWKISIFNRKYIFKWWIFRCHISFWGGNIFCSPNTSIFFSPLTVQWLVLVRRERWTKISCFWWKSLPSVRMAPLKFSKKHLLWKQKSLNYLFHGEQTMQLYDRYGRFEWFHS